ncbi:glycosyltransferase family 8 protein [Xylariaceae sp. FL1651]|nr:glycosyltransferase family 8 protein [Xylariaceae sp. FL1651]
MAVQGEGEEDVYATLLLSDNYLPGALVLAHSLRDAATTKKLAVLVTLDSVSAEAITELKSVYHYVIPVPRIRNAQPANLQLMNRTDLHSAFTKINLWKQIQFRKIVYIDADVVAYRAPDELFAITQPFSAAPDIGWPDLFNTGVMVLTPNMGDYYAMMAMAERGISFDGADQGLLNMYFRDNYNRISFTYNVTPSAHYQYVPAYRHFQSSINMVHFIGPDKPWFKGRYASIGSSPFDEMTGRWWAVYDRHYRAPSPRLTPPAPTQPSTKAKATVKATSPVPELVQYLTKGEFQPRTTQFRPDSKPYVDEHRGHEHHDYHAPPQHQDQKYHSGSPDSGLHGDHHHHHHHRHRNDAHGHEAPGPEANTQQPEPSSFVSGDLITSISNIEDTQAEARQEQIHAQGAPPPPPPPPPEPEPEQKPAPFQPSMSSWDAQRHPPPTDSKPEAINFPATVYEMSKSSAPFVAPQRYPSPPRGMWYEVPEKTPTAPSEPPKAIFPWETHRPRPSRVFIDEQPQDTQRLEGTNVGMPASEQWPLPGAQPSAESSMIETSMQEPKSEPVTPITPTIHITPSDPWTSYTRTNAWDDIPEIERYVDSMQRHRRKRSLKSPGVIELPSPGDGADELAWRRRGSKLTDFPSEAERPSLPVTPAPIRRPKFWGGGGPGIGDSDDDDPRLPRAEGVPGQSEWVCVHGKRWTPADCLCDLANVLRHHKDPVAQLQKLAKQQSEVLLRKLGGSGRDSSDLPPRPLPFGSDELVSPTYVARNAQLLSPRPVKGGPSPSAVLNTVTDLEATPRISPQPTIQAVSGTPTSTGHGLAPKEESVMYTTGAATPSTGE